MMQRKGRASRGGEDAAREQDAVPVDAGTAEAQGQDGPDRIQASEPDGDREEPLRADGGPTEPMRWAPDEMEIAGPPERESTGDGDRQMDDMPQQTVRSEATEAADTGSALAEIREMLRGIQEALERGGPAPNAARATESAGRVYSSLDGKSGGAVSAPGVN
jgi:hypothetical protein